MCEDIMLLYSIDKIYKKWRHKNTNTRVKLGKSHCLALQGNINYWHNNKLLSRSLTNYSKILFAFIDLLHPSLLAEVFHGKRKMKGRRAERVSLLPLTFVSPWDLFSQGNYILPLEDDLNVIHHRSKNKTKGCRLVISQYSLQQHFP